MVFRFYKDDDNRWFVDLPKFIAEGGDKADLEMIAGADEMLDLLSHNGNEIMLHISETKKDCRLELQLLKAYDGLEGSDYMAISEEKNKTFQIWLCSMVLYVFGYYPKNLYIN